MNDIIIKLKNASKAYSLANKYDYCPCDDEEGYIPEVEEYQGLSPYEIISHIKRLIDELPLY